MTVHFLKTGVLDLTGENHGFLENHGDKNGIYPMSIQPLVRQILLSLLRSADGGNFSFYNFLIEP
jgi:hypothetical protein